MLLRGFIINVLIEMLQTKRVRLDVLECMNALEEVI